MKNRLSYDDIMEKYKDKFYIAVELDQPDGECIALHFYDSDDNELYFYVYGKWHPRKREIEYDLEDYNNEINKALLARKQKQLKKKLKQIKKDFK